MIDAKTKSVRTRKRRGNIWGELQIVCKKIHVRLYEKHDRNSALRYRNQLERTLEQLPENDLAIIREEGLALLYELENDNKTAIRHRKREIRLMVRAHQSVRNSVKAGDFDARTAAWVLQGRDIEALEKRRSILRALEQKAEPQRKSLPMRMARRQESRNK